MKTAARLEVMMKLLKGQGSAGGRRLSFGSTVAGDSIMDATRTPYPSPLFSHGASIRRRGMPFVETSKLIPESTNGGPKSIVETPPAWSNSISTFQSVRSEIPTSRASQTEMAGSPWDDQVHERHGSSAATFNYFGSSHEHDDSTKIVSPSHTKRSSPMMAGKTKKKVRHDVSDIGVHNSGSQSDDNETQYSPEEGSKSVKRCRAHTKQPSIGDLVAKSRTRTQRNSQRTLEQATTGVDVDDSVAAVYSAVDVPELERPRLVTGITGASSIITMRSSRERTSTVAASSPLIESFQVTSPEPARELQVSSQTYTSHDREFYNKLYSKYGRIAARNTFK
jgi:hypothetical protein